MTKQQYKNSVPDHMRISEYYLDQNNMKFPDRVAILCKTNGWLMVDGKTRDRKGAFEKNVKNVNCRYTSPTSPPWMQNSNSIGINITKQKEL